MAVYHKEKVRKDPIWKQATSYYEPDKYFEGCMWAAPVGEHERGSIETEEHVGGAALGVAEREAGRAIFVQHQQRHLALSCLPYNSQP